MVRRDHGRRGGERGGRLDHDDEDEEEEETDALREATGAEDGDATIRRSRFRGDDKNAVAVSDARPSEDTAPLRRQVSLPKRAEGDDASEDMGGEMLTIPIPPDSVEDDPRDRRAEISA